jgi:hypothetical protein
MLKFFFRSAILAFLLGGFAYPLHILASTSPSGNLPPAPRGFIWVDFKEGKTSFLKPTGWFEKREIKGGIAAFFLSKENIDAEGKFETGLTLNYIDQVHRTADAVPSEYAKKFVALTAAKHQLTASFVSSIGPGITGFGFRFKDNAASPEIIHYFIVADDPADTLRIILFEASATEWNLAWVVGQQMLNARMWR